MDEIARSLEGVEVIVPDEPTDAPYRKTLSLVPASSLKYKHRPVYLYLHT